MPTIGDVAARANVSTATVSRALNGKTSVDPGLVERVRAAAAELGYQPHGPARSLRRRSAATLALLVSNVTDARTAAVVRGFEDAARARGHAVLIGNTDGDSVREQEYLGVAHREMVAGVALAPTDATDLSRFAERDTPVVAIDRTLPGDQRAVLVSTGRAVTAAVTDLIAAGRRRIACLTSAAPGRHSECRSAYEAAVRTAGLPVLMHPGSRQTVDLLLDVPEPADALLVDGPRVSGAVLGRLAERGLRVGTDVAVVVCHAPEWLARALPAVGVTRYPGYDVGRAAAELLLSGQTRAMTAPVVLDAEFTPATGTRPGVYSGATGAGRDN